MAQTASRAEPHAAVTVAELLRRCAPAPQLDHDDAEPIPVGALLRREGHRNGDALRTPEPATDVPPAPANRRLLVRRSAIAAGALLAAGSVFGLTTAMGPTGDQQTATGTYPGEGALDGVPADAPSTALTGGIAAPTSWMPVAFPTALEGATIAKHALAAAHAAAATTPATATGTGRARAASPSTGRTTTTTPSTTHRSGGVAGTTKTLGDTVSSVGSSTPVADVTSAVGTTVVEVGSTLDATTAPLTAPLTSKAPPSTAGKVVNTVTGLLG